MLLSFKIIHTSVFRHTKASSNGALSSEEARPSHKCKKSASSHAEKILQPVKAAPSKVSSGVPLTLDHPILEAKCKVLVNQLSKAVRFCFF